MVVLACFDDLGSSRNGFDDVVEVAHTTSLTSVDKKPYLHPTPASQKAVHFIALTQILKATLYFHCVEPYTLDRHQWSKRQSASPTTLAVLDDDVAEEEATRFTDGTQTALEARAEELLRAAAVDHEDTQTGRDLPHMLEGDHGKLAAPAQRQRDSAEDAEDVVAASLGAVEAVVGAFPHAVRAVGAIRFRQHVLEGHL